MSGFEHTDLMDPATHSENPWPFYRWLRDECPLYFDDKNQLWAVSRYDDVMQVARDFQTFSSEGGNLPLIPPDASLMCLNGEPHGKRRGLLSKGFTPRRIKLLEEHACNITRELIDRVAPAGYCDIVDDLARQLPMRIIGEMIGYPAEDHARVLEWIDITMKGGEGPRYVSDEVLRGFADFVDYHGELMAERGQRPGDDLLSMWLNAEIDGEKLADEQMLFDHIVILGGGSETTRNAIADGIEILLRHPDQLRHLVEHPEDLPFAVDEIIRWSSPFVRMARTATRDVQMHGRTIERGQEVIMIFPAACRDPRAYDDPDSFDIHRRTDKHAIAFGYGQHFCLGSNLAKLETRVMVGEIIRRLPDLRFAPDKPVVRATSCFVRGLASLPVQFTPSAV